MPYTLTSLGAYQQYSNDPHIHDGLVIAGRDRTSNARFHTHAAMWNGSWTLLPDPATGTDWSIGLGGVSDKIVGHVVPEGELTNSRAALWTQSSGVWNLTLLPMPINAVSSSANSMTADGLKIVGEVRDITDTIHGAMWQFASSSWSTVLLPQPDVRGYAVGVDQASGDVTGVVLDRPVWHASRWRLASGVWSRADLQLPAGDPAQINSDVLGFSDGIAVGSVQVATNPSQAAYWDASDNLHLLGTGDGTVAYGHHSGVFVGSDDSSGHLRGFAWTSAAGREDIHPSGWDWSLPSSVDSAGRIVGVMGMGDPGNEAEPREIFLLTPT